MAQLTFPIKTLIRLRKDILPASWSSILLRLRILAVVLLSTRMGLLLVYLQCLLIVNLRHWNL